jgi:hypothetical protein
MFNLYTLEFVEITWKELCKFNYCIYSISFQLKGYKILIHTPIKYINNPSLNIPLFIPRSRLPDRYLMIAAEILNGYGMYKISDWHNIGLSLLNCMIT